MLFSSLRKYYLAASLLIFVMFFISCSSDSHDAGTPTGSGDNNNPDPVTTDKVTMSGSAFSPAAITVGVGTTVTWTNNENLRHTVTSSNGAFASSGDLFIDDSYSYTFSAVGTYSYFCSFHPGMTGSVTVIP